MELTQQQKLEILCAYLPYGVIMYGASDMWTLHQLGLTEATLVNQNKQNITFDDLILNYSPILRHPDDMTEEELKHLADSMGFYDMGYAKRRIIVCSKAWITNKDREYDLSLSQSQSSLKYLHSLHIDTFGAIEAGWAVRKQLN